MNDRDRSRSTGNNSSSSSSISNNRGDGNRTTLDSSIELEKFFEAAINIARRNNTGMETSKSNFSFAFKSYQMLKLSAQMSISKCYNCHSSPNSSWTDALQCGQLSFCQIETNKQSMQHSVSVKFNTNNTLLALIIWNYIFYKKLIRRWDSKRELSLRRHCTRTKIQ